MELIRYNEVFNSPNVLKFNGVGGDMWLYERDGIIISFLFVHQGFPDRSENPKRIFLSSFLLENLNDGIPVPHKIDKETLILVNCHEQEYAILYSLNIDSEKRVIRLKIIEMPNLGMPIFDDSEMEDIEISY